MRNINEKFENIPEILLVPTDEYDKPINSPQKLDIFKFLVRLIFLLTVIEFLNYYFSTHLSVKY